MSIQLVRTNPLSKFAEAARLNRDRLLRVYIISPWIVSAADSFALTKMIVAVRDSNARLTVVTRPPEMEGHAKAVQQIARLPTAEILFLRTLHAKLYLLECNGLRHGLFGSPNFTPYGDSRNIELAADVRSVKESDMAADFIQSLFSFARELMADPVSAFHKRYGVIQ